MALRQRYGEAGPKAPRRSWWRWAATASCCPDALHAFTATGKPIYGMNKGTVGFLMNEFHEADLSGAAGRRGKGE